MTVHSLFLFPHVDSEASPQALRPLSVAGMTSPVVGGDGGINIAAVEDNTRGVLCSINAYGAPMLAGDKIVVHWGSSHVYPFEVQADQINETLFFYLPASFMVPGWVDVWYELTRLGASLPDDPSVSNRLLVKLDRPAGRDTEPHKPGHSELKIVQLPPGMDLVDAEWAKNGVPMGIQTYPNIAERDSLLVQWGRIYLPPHSVTREQAAGTEPIIITADQATIIAAGDSSSLRVHYDVHDQVWNYSEKWSQATTVAVGADAWRLEAPIIKESTGGIIDLEQLGKKDVTVQIHINGSDFAVGDDLIMTFIGTPNSGKPLLHTRSTTLTNVPSILELAVPYVFMRAIAMGSADAFYVLNKKNNGPSLPSKHAFASVIGQITLLPEPTLREALGDTLEPVEPMATIDISYPGIASGDYINLIWLGTRADGRPYPHETPHTVTASEAANNCVVMYVDGEHIRALENGTLDLSYRVANDNVDLYGVSLSEHALFRVEPIRAQLPIPIVVEADPPDILDPSKVRHFVTVLVDYDGMEQDDILTCDWVGLGDGGSYRDWLPITAPTVGQPVRFRVGEQYVVANIGRYVKVRYALWRAATKRYSYSLTLNLLIGELVGELPPPDVIQAPDGSLDPMQALGGVDVKAGYENMKPTLDTIALRWTGVPGPGSSVDLELPAHESGSVQFHLPASVVGANIGRSILVDYDVKRYGTRTPSQPRDVKVLTFMEPENQLPRPQVPEAVGGVLDLMEIAGNATVTVSAWPFIAARQKAWLSVIGTTLSGGSYAIELLKGQEISAGQATNGLRETLLRSELLKLSHSSSATVVCKIAFAASLEEADAIEFPTLPLTIRTRYDYLTPTITSVSDSRREMEEGDTTFDDTVTFKGTATRGERVELFDAATQTMGTASVNAAGNWEHRLRNLTERVYRINAKALYDAVPVASGTRTFTVNFAMTPTIDSVTDSRGPVGPGGSTYDNAVNLTGSANPNQKVEILDGSVSKGTVDVEVSGQWTLRLTALAVSVHNITAKALYDVDPIASPVRNFQVLQTVTPTISSVSDIRGAIGNGASTYYRAVTLSGRASPNEQIQLLDNNVPIESPVNVTAAGTWTHPLANLTLKLYRLTAKALYSSQPVSAPPWNFTVAAMFTPSITSVTDSAGGQVQHNATTYFNTLTLQGRATPRERLTLLDNGASLRTVDIDTSGNWSAVFSNLTPKFYNFTARAEYTANPGTSPARAFTVASHVAPLITSVRDSRGELQESSTTTDTSVSVYGRVTPSTQVQIYDNNVSKQTATANSAGDWSTNLGVPVGGHSLYARAVTTGQTSNTRRFTVQPVITLQITSVRDSRGELNENNPTVDTSVSVYGRVTPLTQVLIYDNGVYRQAANASSAGDWSTSVSVSVGTHRLHATGAGQTSNSRNFTVRTKLSITWDFNNNTLQGWTPQGRYVGDMSVSGGVVHAFTNTGGNFGGVVMTCPITVEAGRSYDFGFSLAARGGNGTYDTKIQFLVNGYAAGNAVETLKQVNVWKHGTGYYYAAATGTVTLGLWNQITSGDGNDFMIDNIWARER